MVEYGVIALIATLGAISPGPDLAIVTKNSLSYGRNAALWTAVGIGLGIVVHVSYCVLGVAVLIAHSLVVFNIVKDLGACYLIYIGSVGLCSSSSDAVHAIPSDHYTGAAIVARKALCHGFLTNVLNPKCTLFMLSIFTVLVQPHTPVLVQIIYGIEIVLITTVWFVFVGLLLGWNRVSRHIERVKFVAAKLIGVLLICLGLIILVLPYR